MFINFLMNRGNIGITFFHSKGNPPFRRNVLKINSRGVQIKPPQSFTYEYEIRTRTYECEHTNTNLRMLITSRPWTLFRVYVSDIWRMSFLEKWKSANEFSVSKVNCDGNTLLLDMMKHCSAKKCGRFHSFL